MAKKPAPRLVTVCVRGTPARQYRTGKGRIELLAGVVKEIDARWGSLDVVAFPGGFLRLNQYIGDLDYERRRKKLVSAGFVAPITGAVKQLTKSPGVLIVAGVDGPRSKDGNGGDQLCVAWNHDDVIGIGRKIFPVAGVEAASLVCSVTDYGDINRVVPLASGHRAILCACYDMFGVAESDRRNGTQARSIQRLVAGDDEYTRNSRSSGFRATLSRCLNSWNDLMEQMDVTVGIAAIHGFEGHSTTYWQRHGIASCSAALGQGYAVGAAHFKAGLPREAGASTLAAAAVPQSHLTQSRQRRPHGWQPKDAFVWNSEALIRLYATS